MSKHQRTLPAGRRVYRIVNEDQDIKYDTIEIEAKGDAEVPENFKVNESNDTIVFFGTILTPDQKILITYEVEENDEESD